MMRCDSCKHWVAPEKDEWDPVRAKMGVCKRTAHTEDMTEWDGETDDGPFLKILPEYEDRTAAVSDSSGYSATMFSTAAHFCSMFEAGVGL